MKILILEVNHETNTFIDKKTCIVDFENRHLVDSNMFEVFNGTRSTLGGFIDGLSQEIFNPIYCLAAAAAPGGVVTDKAFQYINNEIELTLHSNPDISGALISLHGAMVSELYESADMEIVSRIRKIIGNDIPIVATFDLHGNIDPHLCSLLNGAISCKTYPHIDFYETGYEAVLLLTKLLKNREFKTKVLCTKLPILIPLTCQRTDLHWFREWTMLINEEIKNNNHIHDISTFLGFYFSDTCHLGCSILLTVTDNENDHHQLMDKLSHTFSKNVRDTTLNLLSIDEVKEFLKKMIHSRVVVADTTDNPGAGANGCNISVLKNTKDIEGEALFLGIYNPQVVEQARTYKPGESIDIKIGDDTGNIIETTGTLITLDDGLYQYVGEYDKGCPASFGSSAIIKVGSNTIVFHSVRHQCLDMGFIKKASLDARFFNRIIVKSSVHFRAGFVNWAEHTIEVDSGGSITCDPSKLTFKNAPSDLEIV